MNTNQDMLVTMVTDLHFIPHFILQTCDLVYLQFYRLIHGVCHCMCVLCSSEPTKVMPSAIKITLWLYLVRIIHTLQHTFIFMFFWHIHVLLPSWLSKYNTYTVFLLPHAGGFNLKQAVILILSRMLEIILDTNHLDLPIAYLATPHL